MLLNEKRIWLIFLLLTIVTVACNPTSKGNMYDVAEIRDSLNELDPDSDIIYGKKVFDETSTILPDNVGNKLSCLSCHGDGGLAPNSPMVGVTKKYPSDVRGEYTTMEDRINGCFLRSMNGKRIPENGKEMKSMIAYLEFISKDVKSKDDITWRMTNKMENVPEPDIANGKELFSTNNCLYCHATSGMKMDASIKKEPIGPPLWGERSFNEAAGLTRIETAAGYIQNNMPYGQGGTLNDQEAADIAAYLLSHERPEGDPDAVGDYHLSNKRTYITKKRREEIRNGTFDWTSLDVIVPTR